MLETLQAKWEEILRVMQKEYDISPVAFKTWILPFSVQSIENDVVYIKGKTSMQDQRFIQVIEKRYGNQFRVSISEMMEHELDVCFLPYSDEVESITKPPVVSTPKTTENITQPGLNPKYTFETFVVGNNNDFAFNAALAVADSPGEEEAYNPLFIYGGVGLGKTHLMQAIGNYIAERDSSKKVMYVTSEVFTNELIESIKNERNNTNKAFREKYRNIDVLLIDDIQFIIGKESTQEEFFHTFNTLREAKKQIIITSDRPPKNFDKLEERLRSRFEWGLMIDISPPDYETRMAILRKKAELENYQISNEIMDYIATNVNSNIRELEGALTKLVYFAKFSHKEVTLEFAEEKLKDIISKSSHYEITPELIIKVVADHLKISPDDITSKKRNQEIVFARHIAMYLCRSLTEVPLLSIGSYMGKLDHSTVSHGIDKITQKMKEDESVRNTVNAIKKKLNPS